MVMLTNISTTWILTFAVLTKVIEVLQSDTCRGGGEGGTRRAVTPMKKVSGGLVPPKIIYSCIQDTLIEQSN